MLTLEELDRILKTARPADPVEQETENNKPAPADPPSPSPDPHDAQARSAGWMVLASGEAYEYSLSRKHSVFLFHEENDLWTAWRASWLSGQSAPDKEKTMAEAVPWGVAWAKANEYIQWFKSSKAGSSTKPEPQAKPQAQTPAERQPQKPQHSQLSLFDRPA